MKSYIIRVGSLGYIRFDENNHDNFKIVKDVKYASPIFRLEEAQRIKQELSDLSIQTHIY